MTVLDEFTSPTMRETLGTLMSVSRNVDLACNRMRLAGVNLTHGEIRHLHRLRLVLGHLDADAFAQSDMRPVELLERLRLFAESGVLQIRSVPRFQWVPDFSVYDDRVALIGAHYTELPYTADGIALTCVTTQPDAVRRCARRFDEMWERGYDVLPVVTETLDELLAVPSSA